MTDSSCLISLFQPTRLISVGRARTKKKREDLFREIIYYMCGRLPSHLERRKDNPCHQSVFRFPRTPFLRLLVIQLWFAIQLFLECILSPHFLTRIQKWNRRISSPCFFTPFWLVYPVYSQDSQFIYQFLFDKQIGYPVFPLFTF